MFSMWEKVSGAIIGTEDRAKGERRAQARSSHSSAEVALEAEDYACSGAQCAGGGFFEE